MTFPSLGLALNATRRRPQDHDLTVLPLSEVFGPTYQGEGPYTGHPTCFIRLGLCNLACEWCDTPYTWDTSRYDVAAECPDTPVPVILDRLAAIAPEGSMVTLSGGEPLMHHRKLDRLLDDRWDWHVETNGTIAPPGYWRDLVQHTTVSPKIATRDPEKKRLKYRPLDVWTEFARDGLASFKFVIRADHVEQDMAAVDRVVEEHRIPADRVWIMPEGTRPIPVMEAHRVVVPHALQRTYNTTTRLHTLLWGDERGH